MAQKVVERIDFGDWKWVDSKYYCSDYYDVSMNKYGAKCKTLLRNENKGWIKSVVLMVGFSGFLCIR